MRTQPIAREVWRRQQRDHLTWAREVSSLRLDRRLRGERHPVDDFLWEYYPYSPGKLATWSPGAAAVLGDAHPDDDLPDGFAIRDGVWQFDAAALTPKKREHLLASGRWILDLQERTHARPAAHGCFGLHEWAMVLGQDTSDVRHDDWPLRVSQDQIAATIDAVGLHCTHFDAWRFFTPVALALNPVQPTRATQPDLDQSGCLHANMDLYKWSMRVQPLIPSDFIQRAFELARRIRRVDMQASPYDFLDLGLQPIPLETAAGRARFVELQRGFAEDARAMRAELIGLARAAVDAL